MNLKKTLPCAAHLNGEYGIKNLYAGVPVVIGSQGVEKVIELPLDKNEKDNFNLSINAVKELFEKAIKIRPNEPKLHYNLGLTFKELGEFKKAISSYEKAIEIDPKYFIAHNNLGNVFDELGKTEQAKNSYENTIKINKNFLQ